MHSDGHVRSTAVLAIITMVAFASNSVLGRLALQPGLIDAGTFTLLRLLSGAVVLAVLAGFRQSTTWKHPQWIAAVALFAYAAPFSFAYVRIPVAVGALVLFPAVQLTMIGWDMMHGKRLHVREWFGLVLAMGGLVLLTLPGVSAPDPLGAALMGLAGVAWGVYSIIGRGSSDALANTASNFVYSLLFALPLMAVSGSDIHVTPDGLFYATASGALASGLGYALWYTVLPRISATQAGILQLLVPILATLAGALLLGEPLDTRMIASAVAIVAGVGLAVIRKKPPVSSKNPTNQP